MDSGLGLREPLDRFVGGPHAIRDEAEVDQRRQIAVTLGDFCCGNRIAHHGHFESELQKMPEVGLDTQISSHARQDDLIDTLLPSCNTTSLAAGLYNLCGEQTIVLPSSMNFLNSGMNSAPEPAKPSRVSGPRRSNIRRLCCRISKGPPNFQVWSCG